MTLMALAIALALIVVAAALVLRGVQQRMIDERQSVHGYQRALETLRHVSEQRVNPLVVRPQSPTGPVVLRPDPLPGHAYSDPAPRRRPLTTAVETDQEGDPVPEAAHVVHELVSGRALFGEQPQRRPMAPSNRRTRVGGGVSAIAAAAVIVTAAAVAYALMPGSTSPSATRTSHHPTTPVSKAASGTTSGVPSSLTPTTSTTYTATYQLPAGASAVVLSATGSCWVYATAPATGAVLWTGTLLAGETHSLAAAGTIRVRLGAADNVTMSVAGTSVTLPSGHGSPFDVTFQVA